MGPHFLSMRLVNPKRYELTGGWVRGPEFNFDSVETEVAIFEKEAQPFALFWTDKKLADMCCPI